MNDIVGYTGPLGFWRGMGVFFLRDTVFNVIRFGLFNHLQNNYRRNPEYKRLNRRKYQEELSESPERQRNKKIIEEMRTLTWINLLSTIPAAIITTPLDVVKTRLMTHPLYEPMGAMEHFRKILNEEGFSALFRGAGVRALYVCSLISVFMSLDFFLSYPVEKAKTMQIDTRNELFK